MKRMYLNKLYKDKIIKNILIIASFIIISALSISLLISTHTLFGTGDMQFHIRRIFELRSSIQHGVWLPKFSFNQFHGSAVMSLYPYINLYPLVFLSFFVHSFISLIYVFFGINILVSLLVSFYSSFTFSKSTNISYLFSITYSLSAPFMTYYFGNMDLGVITSLTYFPLIIFGCLQLFQLNNKKWLMMPIGMVFIIYSHVLSIFIISGVVFLWLIINLAKINIRVLIRCLYSLLIIIIFSSIVWIPAIHLILFNINNIRPLDTPQLYGYGILYLFKVSLFNVPNFCLGIFMMFGLLLSLFYYRTFDIELKQIFWISILILFIGSDLFPWKFISKTPISKLLNIFQFSYRFYIIPQIFLCYLFAVCVVKAVKSFTLNKNKFIIFIIIIFGIVSSQLLIQNSIIRTNSNDKAFNNEYIRDNQKNVSEHHKIIINGKIKTVHINDHVVNYKVNRHNGYTSPRYKLTNNSQIYNFCKFNIKHLASLDYYPMDSVINLSNVDNDIVSMNGHKEILQKIGYNKFEVINKYKSSVGRLPLLAYHNENIHLYLNNYKHSYYVDKNGLIHTHVNRGKNIFYIRY